MKDSDYYPAGACNDSSAPYNERLIPEREFDIDVEFVIRKTVTVKTNDYIPEYDDEIGFECANTDNTDWENAYIQNGHFTIQEMLDELKQYVLADMETCSPNTCKGAALKRLLKSCDDWVVSDKTFEY